MDYITAGLSVAVGVAAGVLVLVTEGAIRWARDRRSGGDR